ncbi:MAG: hypothetical protein RRZ93_02515, partial [Ruthenibacterium sp.]
DRMDVIELSSYTRIEKFNIAKKHLLPKQLMATGLKSMVKLNTAALYGLIDGYTQEAGVRSLERTINELLRKCAKEIAAGKVKTFHIGAESGGAAGTQANQAVFLQPYKRRGRGKRPCLDECRRGDSSD